jgi:hypothetical protein
MRLIPVKIESLGYTGVIFLEGQEARVGTIVDAQYQHSDWFGNYLKVQVRDTDGNLRWFPSGDFYPIYPYQPRESTGASRW